MLTRPLAEETPREGSSELARGKPLRSLTRRTAEQGRKGVAKLARNPHRLPARSDSRCESIFRPDTKKASWTAQRVGPLRGVRAAVLASQMRLSGETERRCVRGDEGRQRWVRFGQGSSSP